MSITFLPLISGMQASHSDQQPWTWQWGSVCLLYSDLSACTNTSLCFKLTCLPAPPLPACLLYTDLSTCTINTSFGFKLTCLHAPPSPVSLLYFDLSDCPTNSCLCALLIHFCLLFKEFSLCNTEICLSVCSVVICINVLLRKRISASYPSLKTIPWKWTEGQGDKVTCNAMWQPDILLN